jgi:hypothetical protein
VFYVLHIEVDKAADIRDKVATGNDVVTGDIFKLLGEDGFKTMTQLINHIYETGGWPKDFTEVTMIALKEKPKGTKCSDHSTDNLIAHTAKIVARTIRGVIERKIENELRDQFRSRRVKKNPSDLVEVLRVVSEGNLEIDKDLCACFIDWQKISDGVK